MAAVILITLPTGFGLLPARAPLVPLLMLMATFSAMAVGGAVNGREVHGCDRPMRVCMRVVEAFGLFGIVASAIMIAMVVAGVMDVR